MRWEWFPPQAQSQAQLQRHGLCSSFWAVPVALPLHLRGIKIQNPAAGIAGDNLLVGADFLPGLRTNHHKAGHTFLVAGFGHG